MSHWETNGASDEWHTPQYIFDALGEQFHVDVAAPADGPMHVPCDWWFSKDEDGLAQEWSGLVWMNPPYGGRNSLEPWLDKFCDHGDGIALVPDRTSAPWFQKAWKRCDAVLFMPKVKFIRPDGSLGKSPSNGSALLAIGVKGMEALERAAGRGLGIWGTPVW